MPNNVSSVWRVLEQLWSVRDCFVCAGFGPCAHREAELDLAWVEAQMGRLAVAESVPNNTSPDERNLWLPGLAPGEVSIRVH